MKIKVRSLGLGVAIAIMIALAPGLAVQVAEAGSGHDSMTIVVLSGSPEERGLDYGTAAKKAIKANLDRFWQELEEGGVDRADVLAKANANELGLPDEIRREIRAIAAGADVDYGDLLAMNLYGTALGGRGGCTQFVAVGSGSADGEVIASKNRDESGVNILMIMKPTEDNYGFVAVTEAGHWGVSFGLSETSLCDGNNWMPIPSDAFCEGGYTELTMNRLVLEKCATVDEAIAYVDAQPKYGGSTLMVADKDKAAFIETVPSNGEGYWLDPSIPDTVPMVVTDGVACHANHYMYEPYYSMVIEDGFGSMWTPSIARYDNGIRLIEEAGGVVSAEQVISFCRDLEDFGNSHPNWIKDAHPEIPWECWEDGWPGFSICNARTVSSGVFELNSEYPDTLSRMWTAIYNPCWCPYVPVHNAVVGDPDTANEALMPYRDGTAWLVSMRLRTVEANEWGCLVPAFEEWENEARAAAETIEEQAMDLIDSGMVEEAVAMVTGHDCEKAIEAVDLMISMGSWVNGDYDLTSPGEGLRSGEVGEKQA